MKYKTVSFNANYPTPQQITEPLNSVYGVAVKVYKDGALVDGTLSIDETPLEANRNGWQTCELSTGSVPCTKAIDVAAPTTTSDPFSVEVSGTAQNTNPFPMNVVFTSPLSAQGFVGGETVRASEVEALSALWDGQEVASIAVTVWTLDGDILRGYYIYEGNKWRSNEGLGLELDQLVLVNQSYLQVRGSTPAMGTSTVQITFKAATVGSGEPLKFKLIVQEQDLGYIDIKEQA